MFQFWLMGFFQQCCSAVCGCQNLVPTLPIMQLRKYCKSVTKGNYDGFLITVFNQSMEGSIETIIVTGEFFYFKYILLLLLTYFYLSNIFNPWLLLVVEWFRSVVCEYFLPQWYFLLIDGFFGLLIRETNYLSAVLLSFGRTNQSLWRCHIQLWEIDRSVSYTRPFITDESVNWKHNWQIDW